MGLKAFAGHISLRQIEYVAQRKITLDFLQGAVYNVQRKISIVSCKIQKEKEESIPRI